MKDKKNIHGIITFQQDSAGNVNFTSKYINEAKNIGFLIELCLDFLSDPEMMSKMVAKDNTNKYIEFTEFSPAIFTELKIKLKE